MARPMTLICAARGDGPDAAGERLARPLDEQRASGSTSPTRNVRVEVAVHPVLEGGDVDVDDVAVAQHRVIGDAVADHLVDRGAARLRVAAVAEGGRVGAAGDEVLVRDRVELVGRHAGADRGADRRERRRRRCVRSRGSARPRRARSGRRPCTATAHAADVLGAGDARGHGAGRREASRDQVTGGILGHRISLWPRTSSTCTGTT